MLTLTLQSVIGLLKFAFALAAWMYWRRPPIRRSQAGELWRLTAFAFGFGGLLKIVQDAGAITAFTAGAGSRAWNTYLVWMPVGNHARTVAMLGFGIALTVLAWSRMGSERRRRRNGIAAVLVGGVVGGALGGLEGPPVGGTHYAYLAVLATAQLLSHLAALLVMIARERGDGTLWTVLGVYSFHDALNVVWYTGLRSLGVAGAWVPSPAQMQMYGIVAWVVMIAVTARSIVALRHAPAGDGHVEIMGWQAPAPR